MTIGIPGGHFFFHLSIPSSSFPARPGIPFKKVQNLSKKEKVWLYFLYFHIWKI